MLRRWNSARATGVGILAGLAALLLSPFRWNDTAGYPFYLAAVGLTAFCGLSILFLVLNDIRTHTRGSRMQVVRTFDAIMGLILAVPALWALFG